MLISTYVGYRGSGLATKGDGGPSQGAFLLYPVGVYEDSSGNVLIAEFDAIRNVSASTGLISTLIEFGGGYGKIFGPGVWGVTGNGHDSIYYSLVSGCKVQVLNLTSMNVTTLVGLNVSCGFSGDFVTGGVHGAQLSAPRGLFYHSPSNALYIADTGNHRIRAVFLDTMTIVTIAGSGMRGMQDGVTAYESSFSYPSSVWMNDEGYLFVGDDGNCAIRMIFPDGVNVSTIARYPACSYSSTTFLNDVLSIPMCGNEQGDLYYSLSPQSGLVQVNSTLAGIGNGWQVHQVTATAWNSSRLASNLPAGQVYVGSIDYCFAGGSKGDVYLTSRSKGIVWKIQEESSIIHSVVGFVNGVTLPAQNVPLRGVSSIWANTQGDLYMLDETLIVVAKCDAVSHLVSIVAGSGMFGDGEDGIAATMTPLNDPKGVVGDLFGRLFISEYSGNRIRMVNGSTGLVSTFAGNNSLFDCSNQIPGVLGPATGVALCNPAVMAVDADSKYLYFVDNTVYIKRINLMNGLIELVAGRRASTANPLVDNVPPGAVEFKRISGLWVDSSDVIMVSDGRLSYIISLNLTANMSSIYAGNGLSYFLGDDLPAKEASLPNPRAICQNEVGLFVTHAAFNQLSLVRSSTNHVERYAGSGDVGIGGEEVPALIQAKGDGGPAEGAALFAPRGVFKNSMGDIYVVDQLSLRKIDHVDGTITTLVGLGENLDRGEGVSGASVYLAQGFGLAGDTSGYIYYADWYICHVRALDPHSQTLTSIVGMRGNCSFGGDGDLSPLASLNRPTGLFYWEEQHSLFIADSGNNRIRKVDLYSMIITTIAGNGEQGYTDYLSATTGALNLPTAVWLNEFGDVFIADAGNGVIRKVSAWNNSVISTYATVSSDERPNSPNDLLSRVMMLCGDSSGLYFSSFGVGGVLKVRFDDGFIYRITASDASAGQMSGLPPNFTFTGLSHGCFAYDTGRVLVSSLTNYNVWDVDTVRDVIVSLCRYVNGVTLPITAVSFDDARGLWLDSSHNLFVVDSLANMVSKVDARREQCSVVAGTGSSQYNGDSIPATMASLNSPQSIAGDSVGSIYVVEAAGRRVRKVSGSTGYITTI
eukprot:gene8652-9533_t